MGDIKLFSISKDGASELPPSSMHIEKTVQNLFEANLETLLGVRFLASEFSTGPVHGGRIDSLGLDEDGCPVIIEYKRSVNENVINQGLFYLDWLMDHRKEFQWLVLERLGQEAAANVDWSSPRLLCIAGDFTRYDEYAVKQINRNIELLRYRLFGTGLLMIDLLHVPSSNRIKPSSSSAQGAARTSQPDEISADPYTSQRIAYRLENASEALRSLFDTISEYLTALGDDVQIKQLKNYVAFKRIKNFVCLELYPQSGFVMAYLKIDPATVTIEPGFTRDVRKIGHFGTGDLEVTLRNVQDFERAVPLFQTAYERG